MGFYILKYLGELFKGGETMGERNDSNSNHFRNWLSKRVSSGQLSDIYFCYTEIEKHGYKTKLLARPLLETTELTSLSRLRSEIEKNRLFRFWHKKQMKRIGLAMTLYISYVKEVIEQNKLETSPSIRPDNQSDMVSTSLGGDVRKKVEFKDLIGDEEELTNTSNDFSAGSSRNEQVHDDKSVSGITLTGSIELQKTIKFLEKRYDVRLCYDYLSNPDNKRNDVLYKANNGKKDVIWIYFIHSSRSHYVSIETEPEYLASIHGELEGFTQIRLRDSHPRQKMIFNDFEKILSSLLDICESIDLFFANSVTRSSVTIEHSTNEISSETLTLAEPILKEADLEGMTIDELAATLNSSVLSVKKFVQRSTNIVSICGKQIHKAAFVDWTFGADQLERILDKLMKKNNGYVSDVQLYDYARVEMQMFLNDNDMDDQRKVFDLAEHLFDKEKYHGKHYSFRLKTHISLDGEVVNSKLDVMFKYARSMGGCFKEKDLESYLQGLGIKTASLRQQMKVYDEPLFLVYQPGIYITAESMCIDEEWLGKIANALSKLFTDTGDHVVLRDIQPWWFLLLPILPNRLPWTPLLLQSVLLHFGDRLGARTIYAIAGQAVDRLHVMVVSNNSEVQTFADAVIATLLENHIDKRSFSTEELRRMLIHHGLIAENELLWNMPKAIPNDERFAWDADGQHVIIRI